MFQFTDDDSHFSIKNLRCQLGVGLVHCDNHEILQNMNNLPMYLILDNLRSAANVGSLIRTANALGIRAIYVVGYTPYPEIPHDLRPPHIRHANTKAIVKTSLGAENALTFVHFETAVQAVAFARDLGCTIAAIEQSTQSVAIQTYQSIRPIAIILGNEVVGLSITTFKLADVILEIPMLGSKESYGVAIAGAIAMYALRASS